MRAKEHEPSSMKLAPNPTPQFLYLVPGQHHNTFSLFQSDVPYTFTVMMAAEDCNHCAGPSFFGKMTTRCARAAR